MKPLSLARILTLTLASVAFLAPQLPAQNKLIVALKPDKNPEAMLAEKTALAAILSKHLARPVEVIIPLATAAILQGFGNGTIDLAYLSASDMVTAQENSLATLLLAGEIDGKTSYQSYWVALKESPISSINDLRGKKVAFSSRTSTSGFVIPLWDLHQKNLIPGSGSPEAFFGAGNTWYGTGYVSAVERVLNNEAAAAAVSYYVLDKDKHLTPEQRARLKKVAEQGPVPTHVIAARLTLAEAERVILKDALLTLNTPENADLRDKIFTSKLVETDPVAHLRDLGDALKLAKTQSAP